MRNRGETGLGVEWSRRPFGIFLPLLLCLPAPAFAVAPLALSGSLAGTVRDVIGKPQMGANVFLFDRREKLLHRVLTNEEGTFSFAGLTPDSYSIRVTLTSFLPAVRDQIRIEAGIRRLLDVNLSALFSSVQFSAPNAAAPVLMKDDWRWVSRTGGSLRPVLRILPGTPSVSRTGPIFSDTRGLVKVSAGDPGSASAAFASEGDMGTAFAFSTSLYGSNQLQFSGNLGYASGSGLPSAAFQTAISRPLFGSNPEISVSMRQLSVPDRSPLPGMPNDGNVPRLRTMAVGFGDKTPISDSLDLEYGFEMDAVSYDSRMHYFSPYARLTYHLDANTNLDLTYTSGNARPDLGSAPTAGDDSLERDVAALSRIPRISLRNGRDQVQRGENYELGVSRKEGSRVYRLAGYRESVKNAALTISGAGDAFNGDVLPDLFSNTGVFDAGDYHTAGYTASVTQNLADDRYKVTVMYGSVGVLVPDTARPVSDADELRSLVHATHRNALTAQAAGTAPVTGTRFFVSYQWTDDNSATSGHMYSTDPSHPEPGLNVYLRQPIPSLFGLPARLELTGDFRNLMAQGYLPFSLTDGQRFLLMRTPRSFRGGLSFRF